MNFLRSKDLLVSCIWGIGLWGYIVVIGYIAHLLTGVKLGNTQTYIPDSLIIVIILGPLLETLIFQYLPFTLFNVESSYQRWVYLLLSSISFGLSHYSHIYLLIATTIIGFLFAFRFLLVARKINSISAIVSVFISHTIPNALSAVLDYI